VLKALNESGCTTAPELIWGSEGIRNLQTNLKGI